MISQYYPYIPILGYIYIFIYLIYIADICIQQFWLHIPRSKFCNAPNTLWDRVSQKVLGTWNPKDYQMSIMMKESWWYILMKIYVYHVIPDIPTYWWLSQHFWFLATTWSPPILDLRELRSHHCHSLNEFRSHRNSWNVGPPNHS